MNQAKREANKATMRRFIEEVWNQGHMEVADEIFDQRANRPSAAALPPGPMGVKIIAQMFRSAYPDYHMDIEFMVAEEDRVVPRFRQRGTHQGELMGIPPTGKSVDFKETGILRSRTGKGLRAGTRLTCSACSFQLGVAPMPRA
jgi:predicted ester cyclase